MSGELTDSIAELAERCERLERLVCMLAAAALCHEYSKDLHRAGPIEVFQLLAQNEVESADRMLRRSRGEYP